MFYSTGCIISFLDGGESDDSWRNPYVGWSHRCCGATSPLYRAHHHHTHTYNYLPLHLHRHNEVRENTMGCSTFVSDNYWLFIFVIYITYNVLTDSKMKVRWQNKTLKVIYNSYTWHQLHICTECIPFIRAYSIWHISTEFIPFIRAYSIWHLQLSYFIDWKFQY